MTSRTRLVLNIAAVAVVVALGASIERLRSGEPLGAVLAAGQQTASSSPAGQSATQLADGRWLLVGGVGIESRATLWDPVARTATATGGQPAVPRAFHSATVLPDGRVLVIGGRQGNGLAELAEVFDPVTGQFSVLPTRGSVARASHTATLLTDGRVVVAGGSNGSRSPLATEVWDVSAQTVTTISAPGVDRVSHEAILRSDGSVLISGGRQLDGPRVNEVGILDPQTGTMRRAAAPTTGRVTPMLAGTLPAGGSSDVPVDAHIALRFSDAMATDTLTAATISLSASGRSTPVRIVVAEGGRLAFIWPMESLADGTTYIVAISGVASAAGVPMAPTSIAFTTRAQQDSSSTVDAEEWIPDAEAHGSGRWRANRPPSPWEALAPLMAPQGVTAISGRTLTLDGRPLRDVTFTMDDGQRTTTSDTTGRFLLVLDSPRPGRRVLRIDGTTAKRGRHVYGFFEYGFSVVAGQTNVLPFTIWMPALDTTHAVRIPSPTTREVVVTTPRIPGLELHIPPNTVLRGRDGKPVSEVTLTAIPVDRPPFPLARNVDVPVYFTAQPGGAYVETLGSGAKGAWLVYPNYHGARPKQRVQFFHYDPDVKDWYVYGLGTVTAQGLQVEPGPTTRVYEFTGAMINDGEPDPDDGEPPGDEPDGDPVSPSRGVFLLHKTDLYLPDVIPLAMRRTYNSGDIDGRVFGTGMTHPYAMFLWSAHQYTEADLILPEGGKVHFVRTSPGTGWTDAIFVHQETGSTSATPTRFYKATMVYNGNGWDVTLKDGTVFVFGDNAPLQAIRDRYGNQVDVIHANGQSGNVTGVVSPHGRWLTFTYDGNNRITQVKDNIGRTVSYAYTNGDLTSVTDAENNVTTYGYDTSHRMVTVRDGRNITFLTNTYTNGRVTDQTLASPSYTYAFSYTINGAGVITQTDVTDPRGYVKRLAFNNDGYMVSRTEALGDAKQRTTTFTRQAGSNLVTSQTDALNRLTDYTYDTSGHVLTVTKLAGTANAVTSRYTYEPKFSQLATLTDPLNHTWTTTFDASGTLTGATDPLSHHVTVALNGEGQVSSITDPLNHAWQFGYAGADRVTMTNPLGAVWRQFFDGAGRILSTNDPLGNVTRTTMDKLNRVTAVIDPSGDQTSFSYDPNGNLTSLTDALSHATTYTYDNSDRISTRTDALNHSATYQYDAGDHLIQATDRKSQVTSRSYDALNRLAQITFNDNSTIAYTYDAGDRLTQIADSANGTITRAYDDLDRLTSETTPEGAISYTYDNAGRRATLAVAGQTTVSYAYDNANRLTSITQGTSVVAFAYDDANHRTSLTYPNGIVVSYGYDDANQLTSLTYTAGATTLGALTYSYDLAGRRTAVGGSWARSGIPQAVTAATYDGANRIVTWGGVSFSYDVNGNVTSDGARTYAWNARDQLTAISGAATGTFAYDALGRRRSKVGSGNTTRFMYDRLNIVQELAGSGTPTANWLTAPRIDESFTRSDGAGTSTILTDAIGSTIALADVSAAIQTSYTYEPFGQASVSGTTSGNAVQYTGRDNDGTGLYFYRSRYYSAGFQRFMSEDRVNGLGFSLYAYALNRPTTLTDPLGLWPTIPGWVWDWWNIFWPTAGGAAAGAAGPAGELADDAMTLEEARKLQEKAQEEIIRKRASDEEILRAICQTQDWPSCRDLPERKKPNPNEPPDKKRSKTDPDEPDGIRW
jgi:RHS repeat-associated protein